MHRWFQLTEISIKKLLQAMNDFFIHGILPQAAVARRRSVLPGWREKKRAEATDRFDQIASA
ncbi:MAG: hypothetical protein SCI25_00355 [Desulfuromonadales bacterium]|nr:hypothetical protein [Desulfuromonadales bacterium]MDW7758071.1 hypothetical protein [Desulfuromonadales bacterium]